MSDFASLASQFTTFYYQTFDSNRSNLAALYKDHSMLTFEGQQFQGTRDIVSKLTSLPFQRVQHKITSIDVQPSAANMSSIVVFVTGQLLIDDESNPQQFSQVFNLYAESEWKQGKLLAISDEQGNITLLDTRHSLLDKRFLISWTAHHNCIFDLDWIDDERDQSARLWDIETQVCLSEYIGHSGSLKSVSVSVNPFVFVTSGRDGHVMVYDRRTSNSIGCISNAHTVSVDRRRRKHVSNSVTCVSFLHNSDYTFMSSGASDGLLKCWDMRNAYTRSIPISTTSIVTGDRPFGLASFAIDKYDQCVYAVCVDHKIYKYNVVGLGNPVDVYSTTSFQCSSFYVRVAVSGDGDWICTGSSSCGVYVWNTGGVDRRVWVYRGHEKEVSGVDWVGDDWEVSSCGDDRVVRTWNLHRGVRGDGSGDGGMWGTCSVEEMCLLETRKRSGVEERLKVKKKQRSIMEYFNKENRNVHT